VERLLTTIAEMDYPKHLLEIQVLDDSTDDSVVETEALIHKIAVGLDIKHIRRSNRTGYKQEHKEGLLSAKGEFIAIFDADFVPQKTGSIKPFLILRIQKWGCSNPLGTSKTAIGINKKIQV
jgi:cellulose synthase/poly-beta-1,6-N-acetylglucosamine synthase-like glycosyltransferase